MTELTTEISICTFKQQDIQVFFPGVFKLLHSSNLNFAIQENKLLELEKTMKDKEYDK